VLILSILHNIFLDEEQINSLSEKEEIEVIGVSLPVWYYKGNTSEPAEEVFCKYKITNKTVHKKESITIFKNGYIINLPKISNNCEKESLEKEEKINEIEQVNIKDLISKEQIIFKQFNKKKQKGKLTNLIHVVKISKIEKLINSLTSF
jgi:hypothetical protein